MNDKDTESPGLKWLLRLVAPLVLVLLLFLGHEAYTTIETGKVLLDDVLKGEPLSSLTATLLVFGKYLILLAIALALFAIGIYEAWGASLSWGLSLGLACLLVAPLPSLAHYCFHKEPFYYATSKGSSYKWDPPPPEHQCPACGGWKSWPEKKK
ncbi:MAG: hypothetical protein RL095_4140 [Verrucomicrobiota bacterium]|jgi:hypothetical protein